MFHRPRQSFIKDKIPNITVNITMTNSPDNSISYQANKKKTWPHLLSTTRATLRIRGAQNYDRDGTPVLFKEMHEE
jgi:hypothetical protein